MTTKSAINFRTTYILMGGVAVLLGVLAIYVFFGGEKQANPEGFLLETFHAVGTKPNEITGLEIDKGGEKIAFARQNDGRWRIVQPIEARADSDRVEELVQQVLSAKREEHGADVTPNLGIHGLDNPALKITLNKGERSTALSIGKVTVGGEQSVVYVLSSDEPKKPQATRKTRLRGLFRDKPAEESGPFVGLDDFRTKKLLGEGIELAGSANHITGIKLTEKWPKGEKVVSISRNNPERVWRFAIPPGYGDVELNPPAPTDQRNPSLIQTLPQLLNTALSIEVPEVKDYLREQRDLGAVGLDPSSPDVLRVDIERQDAVGSETLWIGKGEVKSERDKVYARYEGDAAIAQINGEKARILRKFLDDPSTLREATLVKLRKERVDAIDVTMHGQTFQIRKGEANRWKVYDGAKVHDANAGLIEDLIFRLSQPRGVRGYPSPDAKDEALGFDKPVVELKIWEDGLLPPETGSTKPKVKETPTVRIQFGRKDLGDIVYVRRYQGLTKTDVKMPDALLASASRGRLDYLEVAVAGFKPEEVLKVSFNRGADLYVIERQDKDGRPLEYADWIIAAPEAKKGKHTDPDKMKSILMSFHELRPEKVVSEKATEDELKSMGLDPAKSRLKLAMKLKDDPAERVYFLGNDVAGKRSVYTKTSLADYVFESPSARLEIATLGELVDPVIYRVEAGNVKGMKLKGWVDSSATGMPQTLELERKPGGVWTPKAKIEIDSDKVEQFLAAILKPRAEAMVLEKTGPKPEHGLDLAKGALEVEIELIEGKPVTLTLGAVNKDTKLLYAESNRAKGDVFSLKGDKLLPVKEKPATFKKD